MRTLKSVAICLLLASHAQAALSGAMEWNVRGGDGSDNNGGAFKRGATGTDWSLVGAAHQAYTDIVIGGTTTQVTSAAHPFASTDVGNIINITGGSGCTTGRFEVTGVTVVTATLDRSAGTAASTCTGNLGGALATIATALASVVTANTLHIQSGTYTVTSSLTAPGPNLYTEGYGTTFGDGGTKPLITTATNSTTLWKVANSSGGSGMSAFYNLSFSNTASVRAKGFDIFNALASLVVRNCVFDGFTTAINSDNGSSFDFVGLIMLSGVEIKNGTVAVLTVATNGLPGDVTCYACYLHDNSSSSGVVQTAQASTQTYVNSVIASNGMGATGARQINFVNSNVVSNTLDGVNTGGSVNATNTIFYGNVRDGINCNTCISAINGFPATGAGCNNAFGANGTDFTNGTTGPGQITLTANPFTSSTNFTLNSTSGGGPLLKKLGCAATINGSTTVGTLDVGAVQGAQSSGYAFGSAH